MSPPRWDQTASPSCRVVPALVSSSFFLTRRRHPPQRSISSSMTSTSVMTDIPIQTPSWPPISEISCVREISGLSVVLWTFRPIFIENKVMSSNARVLFRLKYSSRKRDLLFHSSPEREYSSRKSWIPKKWNMNDTFRYRKSLFFYQWLGAQRAMRSWHWDGCQESWHEWHLRLPIQV